MDREDSMDRSSRSLGAKDISKTGASLSIHVARKIPEVKMGAQPDQGKHSQVHVAEQQVSWSHQISPHSSQDAAAVPPGNTPCLAAEMIPKKQTRLFHPQEAPLRQPLSTRKAFTVAGQIF